MPGLDGTRLYVKKLGSNKAIGGTANRADEFILKDNIKYLLRITNDTVSNNWVNVNIDYYVHPSV